MSLQKFLKSYFALPSDLISVFDMNMSKQIFYGTVHNAYIAISKEYLESRFQVVALEPFKMNADVLGIRIYINLKR